MRRGDQRGETGQRYERVGVWVEGGGCMDLGWSERVYIIEERERVSTVSKKEEID